MDPNNIEDNLDQLQNTNGDIESFDVQKIKKVFFPTIKHAPLFISHSHADYETAQDLAKILVEITKKHAFIDSNLWGYAGTLLDAINKKNASYHR